MQQTSKYQFKLIEGTDDFSPTPLNDNMEKVEEALEGLTDDFLARIGAGGSTCRVAYGTYVGTGTVGSAASKRNSLTVPFRPLAVLLADPTRQDPAILIRGASSTNSVAAGYHLTLTWTDDGVSWSGSYDAQSQANVSGRTYHYVVLGDCPAEE